LDIGLSLKVQGPYEEGRTVERCKGKIERQKWCKRRGNEKRKKERHRKKILEAQMRRGTEYWAATGKGIVNISVQEH